MHLFWTNTTMIFCFCSHFGGLKKYPWKHMRLCMVLEERKTPKDSSCCSFVSKSCAQNVIYMYNNKRSVIWTQENTWSYLTRKALLTEKVLWHYELTNKTETGWNKKNQEALKAWSTRGSYFWTKQEQAPFCNCGAIPLRLAFPQKLLQKCWIVLRLLTMFAPNFFGMSRCWGLNKDDRSIGRNFTRVIS